MLRHLRLAKARGSLVAPNGPLQDRALEFSLLLEEIQHSETTLTPIKVALATRTVDNTMLASMFPGYFPAGDPFRRAYDTDGTFDPDAVDEDQIEWDVPDVDTDAEIARWIAQRESASFSAADLDSL